MKRIGYLIVCLFLSLSLFAVDADTLKAVKILAIGNSFARDAVGQNFYELADAEGIPIIIGIMHIGGCSLERHLNNARSNSASYTYMKTGLDGKKVTQKEVTLEATLADEEWDYVSFQQSSPLSGMYETYEASLPELVEYTKERLPKKTKLMLHQTWAYQADATRKEFENYDHDQSKMYQSIIKATKKAAKLTKIKIIIPTGTAIQNARTTFVGDHLTRDGYHLDLIIGRYTAACCWFEQIFKRSVVGNSYAPEGLDESRKRVAQEAAHAAVKHPSRITDISVFD